MQKDLFQIKRITMYKTSFETIRGFLQSFSLIQERLIQKRQLSVSGKKMCTILVNRLDD